MKSARVRIPAVEQLQGVAGGTGPRAARRPVSIKLTRSYLEQGLDRADTKQVFAEIVEPIAGLSIPAERAGGLASPKFPDMDGVSRLMGPVSDVRNFAGADTPPLDPAALIGDTKLLGTIALKEIVDLSQASDLSFLTTQPDRLFEKVVNEPDFVLRRPVISSVRTGSRDRDAVRLEAEDQGCAVRSPRAARPAVRAGRPSAAAGPHAAHRPGQDDARARGSCRGPRRRRPAHQLRALAGRNGEGGFQPGPVRVPHGEEDRGHDLDREGRIHGPTRVRRGDQKGDSNWRLRRCRHQSAAGRHRGQGTGLQLPAVGLGVLSLQNIAFNSSLSLPFVENPVGIRFALSERSNPFIVSVAPFGGTGFFALEMRTSGPDRLSVEAAIEFGGIITFNLLDIVKGGVYVLAGVYMLIRSGGSHQISAHLRIGGYVDVLGLISVSIELYLALTFDGSRLRGMARLTIGVKVLFFSKSFSFEVEKEIAHLGAIPGSRSPAGPRRRAGDFRSLVDRPQWESYCRAFA